MRAVVQRVTSARVHVGGRVVAEIAHGLLALVGIGSDDTDADVRYVADKILQMRVFAGEDGRPMHRSVREVGGAILVVSQFTLYGDVRRGRRPAFDEAASAAAARDVYDALVRELRESSVAVSTGEFQALMQVELVNDGPVTILIESRRRF